MNRPKVGVGVIVMHHNKILMGKRLNSHGHGDWAPPGGHLEYGEVPEHCAAREVLEETGLVISHLTRLPYTSDVFAEKEKHYITLWIKAEHFTGELELKEPEKCAEWRWFELDNLPDELFIPMKNLRKEQDLIKLCGTKYF